MGLTGTKYGRFQDMVSTLEWHSGFALFVAIHQLLLPFPENQ